MVDVYASKWKDFFGQEQIGIFIGEPFGLMGYGLISPEEDGMFHILKQEELPRLVGYIRDMMKWERREKPLMVEDSIVKPVINEIERLGFGETTSERLTKEARFLINKIRQSSELTFN